MNVVFKDGIQSVRAYAELLSKSQKVVPGQPVFIKNSKNNYPTGPKDCLRNFEENDILITYGDGSQEIFSKEYYLKNFKTYTE